MKKIITSILFICFISWSCSKNNDTSISPNSQILREIKSINNIEIDNSLAEKFLTSDEFQILRKTTKESKIESIAFVEFKDSRLQGLIIKLVNNNTVERDIFMAQNSETEIISCFLREKRINIDNDNKISGYMKWYTFDNEILNSIELNKSKITHFQLSDPMFDKAIQFNQEKSFDKNSKIKYTSPCKWICTSAEFNKNYQAAKNECESDWLCDFSCSFNPCAISYAAAATIKCTSCSF